MEECRKTNALHFKCAARAAPRGPLPLASAPRADRAGAPSLLCVRYSPVSPCDAFSVALQKCLKAQKEEKKTISADKGKRSRDRLGEAMRRAKAEEAAMKK